MEIKVYRDKNRATKNSTPSKIEINKVFQCFAIEPPRELSSQGLKCIPVGKYQVTLRQDGNVWGWMQKAVPGIGLENGIPWIYNIEGETYPLWHDKQGVQPEQFVLIHDGNYENGTENDSLGCLVVGMEQATDFVGSSAKAFKLIYPQILSAIMNGEQVTIEYVE